MRRSLIRFISIFLISGLIPLMAFAQTPPSPSTILTPPAIANGTDQSINYLQNIFGVVDGVLHGSGSQIMGQMFQILNIAALALGGIIVMFTILVSTLNTAHEGEIMGRKWSSVWIPIRTVTGIALLLPKATGYSIIQIFMMWVIVQGIGAADTMWDQVLKYLNQGGMIVQQAQVPNPAIITAAKNIYRANLCMAALQAGMEYNRNQAIQAGGKNIPAVPPLATTIQVTKDANNQSVINLPGTIPPAFGTYPNIAGACGTISWDTSTDQTTNDYREIATRQMITELQTPAQAAVGALLNFQTPAPDTSYQVFFPNCSGIGTSTGGQLNTPENSPECRRFVQTAADYRGIMSPISTKAATAGSTNFISNASSGGWIFAGRYYSELTSLNIKITNEQKPPNTTAPNTTVPINNQTVGSLAYGLVGVPNQLINTTTIQTMYDFLNNKTLNNFINNAFTNDQTYGGAQSPLPPVSNAGAFGIGLGLSFVPIIGPIIQVVTSLSLLGESQQRNFNPITGLAMLGSGMINAASQGYIILAMSAAAATGALGAVPFVTVSAAIPVALQVILPLLNAILLPLLITGVTMVYFIPLIPFFIFLFGALGWIVLVIEAMVAAPLVALGIIHPEGGHELLGRAESGVMILVNVFLRPSLMIIGFIAGIILSYVGVWILNQGFFAAFAQNMLSAGGIFALLFGIIALPLLYTVAVIAVVNQSFTLINVIPDRVMRWIGGSPESISSDAARELQEIKGESQGGMQQVGSGVGATSKAAGERADKRNKAEMEGGGGGGGGSSESKKTEKNEPQVAQVKGPIT